MSENVMELINAIQSGKSLEIESSFNKVMADKLHSAINARREEISRNLFTSQEKVFEPVEASLNKKQMKFETLRTEIKPTESSSFLIEDDVCSFVESSWYLNEEKVYVEGFDDAVVALNEKIKNYKEKINGLLEENYSIEQVFRIVKKYNTKVSQSVLENCIKTASSKQLTNDKIVLELRRQDCNLANDKYLFVLENNEVVALTDSEMLMLEKFDEELLAHGTQSAENLKQIFRGIY